MLHLATVEPRTLGLLKNLMAEPEFAAFNLVGGTALSLQIGHRKSVDLDMFGFPPELKTEVIVSLLSEFGNVEKSHVSKNILQLRVDDIKVDFVRYKYPLLGPVSTIDGIRLASLADIAAMKLAAITGRGRKRDFIDLFFLMKHFSLAEITRFYEEKYPDSNLFMVMKSLDYFADADTDEDSHMFLPAPWKTVKTTIETAVKQHFR